MGDQPTEKAKSVFDYVKRADLSSEELGQLIGLLVVDQMAMAIQEALK